MANVFLWDHVIHAPLTNASDLAAIDVTGYVNGVIANVINVGVFVYNNASSATADNVTVIQPSAGPGRWLVVKPNLSSAYSLLGSLSIAGQAQDIASTQQVISFLQNPTSANLQAAINDDTGSGNLVFSNSPTIDSPTLTGTITTSGLDASKVVVTNGDKALASYAYSSSSTANTIVSRDSNANILSNNAFFGLVNTFTDGGSITFTAATQKTTYFAGSSNQTIVLPDTASLSLNTCYEIFNSGTGTITVNAVDASLVVTIPSFSYGKIICIANVAGGFASNNWTAYTASYSLATTSIPTFNNLILANTDTVSSGGTTVLTQLSTRSQTLTGTQNHTYRLPSGILLTVGMEYFFSNKSSGTLTIVNNSGTTLMVMQGGGNYGTSVRLTNNSSAAGSWQQFNYPSASNLAYSIVQRSSAGAVLATTFSGSTFSSGSSNPSTTGLVKLTSTESIGWRNNANTADLALTKNTSDVFNFPTTLTLGATSGTTGTLGLIGTTSGTVTIQPQAAAGNYNFNLPTTAGTIGALLQSAGGGSSPMVWTQSPTLTGLTFSTSGIINYDFTANSGATFSLNPANGYSQGITLTANCAITLASNPSSTTQREIDLDLIQDGTGSRSVTWSNVTWATGSPPVLNGIAGSTTSIFFIGTTRGWIGYVLPSTIDSTLPIQAGQLSVFNSSNVSLLTQGVTGVCQYVSLCNTVNTTSATTTTLQTISVPTASAYALRGFVKASRTGGASGTTGDSGTFFIQAGVKNPSGTASVIGGGITAYTDQAWTVALTPSGSSILVNVTGSANNNITWTLFLESF